MDNDKQNIITSLQNGPKNEVLTSLPLQAFFHFNVYFAPILLIYSVSCLLLKYSLLSVTYQVLLVSVLIVYCTVECVRLLLGYYGNLGEKIPALSGFWISSLLVQLPLILFLLLDPDTRPLPIERAIYSIHLVFLVGELLTGFDAIRRISNYQMQNFQKRIEEDEKTAN
ncbi:unnamed protein product, partial [Mesorhabditis spiculigera]